MVIRRRITSNILNTPKAMKGRAFPFGKRNPPNFRIIDLPIIPENPKNPTSTPLISFGMFLEKNPSSAIL